MSILGTVTIAEGQKELAKLLEDIQESSISFNEAETRFHIIDKVLKDCLGWPTDHASFRLEVAEGRQYSDYELGSPRKVIVEAKKLGRTFELPADHKNDILCDLQSIIALGSEAAEAIQQVQSYCVARGVEIAIATNGNQYIAFLASRKDGKAPLEGKCLRINSLKHFYDVFPKVWQMLSPEGIAKQFLQRFLRLGEDKMLPDKLAKYLPTYPSYKYPSNFQSSLRNLSELLLIDHTEQSGIEKKFYEECYCESGALSQHALISKQILTARYSALFDPSKPAPIVSSAIERKGKSIEISQNIQSEVIALRPVVLLGDVGVGKTSFLKNLMYVRASEEFKVSIFIYIDLGLKGALSTNLNEFVVDEIERQLLEKYDIDIYEEMFIKGVYSKDIQRFSKGMYGSLKDSDPTQYEAKRRDMLIEKSQNKDAHLKASIVHISTAQSKQIIVALDNADQRSYDIQQEAFIISHNLAKDWNLMVFISVRPQTFYYSKHSGALTAYPNRIFTISPPRVDTVLESRLKFALNMAEGRISIDKFKGITLDLKNIATFIKVLLHSIKNNVDIIEFLSNITGGNIRQAIDLVTKLIGNSNIDAEKIITIMEEQGNYTMPVHEFWKAALLGDYEYYDTHSSIAANIFDVHSANSNEHFLLPMILGFIVHTGKQTKEFFVETAILVDEMQDWGFTYDSIAKTIKGAVNKKLIETPQRITFEEDEPGFYENMPTQLRITTIGAYHLKKWISDFAYLDIMLYDTPLFDKEFEAKIKTNLNSLAISDRYNRADNFRQYLTKIWGDSDLNPDYFNWNTVISDGEKSFKKVSDAISKHTAHQNRAA